MTRNIDSDISFDMDMGIDGEIDITAMTLVMGIDKDIHKLFSPLWPRIASQKSAL